MKTIDDLKRELHKKYTEYLCARTEDTPPDTQIMFAVDYLFKQGLLQLWQPIETAPKDVPILGCAEKNGLIDIIQLDTPVDWRYFDQPTAWMPLPKVEGDEK